MNTTKDAILYQQLRTALVQWVDLTEPQWRSLASIFRVRTVQRQEHVLLPGAGVQELSFVCRGLLRFYCLADDGLESNLVFVAENRFACPLSTFSANLPLIYGIQAIEPTTYLTARYTDFFALCDQDPVFDRLGRRLSELSLTSKELRTRSLLQQQAQDRYLDFVRQHPNLAQRVPQYHIASYLGITEVSLSRLKRALAQETLIS
jgi:CRP-like cAMP-binding protein